VKADILIAGIGNIFLGDDGFGVEVVNELSRRTWPPAVEVADFGIRGVHLAYQLLDGYRALVLVDAVPMDEEPGTLAVLEPQLESSSSPDDGSGAVLDAHTMSPDVVLATLAHLGGKLEQVYVVGCQPADLQERIGLSPQVAAAVGEAAGLCTQLVHDMLQHAGKGIA
jgi:hydrogenase maturation protease